MGANLWYAMHLACDDCPNADRLRLSRELDRLAAMGVTVVTVLASGEGSEQEGLGRWYVQPSLQPTPGEYNHNLLVGLDFVLKELGIRGMSAVMVLNNAWPWSGGMGQYLDWAEDDAPNSPSKDRTKFMNVESWQKIGYFKRVCDFFDSDGAIDLSHRHIKFLLARRNSFTGRIYSEDPTIMAWQLAHEPRPLDNRGPFLEWIQSTSSLIKRLAPHHMVTIGSEGAHASRAEEVTRESAKDPEWSPWVVDTTDFEAEHKDENIDFATVSVWPAQWGFTQNAGEQVQQAWVARAREYLEAHIDAAMRLGKPIVIHGLGMPRDGDSYLESSKTRNRNTLLSTALAIAHESMTERGAVAGVTFSGWAGEGRKKHGLWEQGDPFIAEPPHEYQGWNSIYNTDVSTIQIVTSYAERFAHVMAEHQGAMGWRQTVTPVNEDGE